MKGILFCLFILFAFVSCTEDDHTDEYVSKFVVEGWIEDGGYPIVMLTRSLSVNSEFVAMDDLRDYILRWAKVTVSDGKDSVILTGKYDAGYFPPYIYTTSRMKGVVGKEYTLTVEYRDEQVTARTTIPQQPPHCSFAVEKCVNSDTLFQVIANFVDIPDEKNFYQFFVCVGTQTKQYLPSYLGSIDDEVVGSSVIEMPIYRGHQLMEKDYTPYFSANDTVCIKFAQVDKMTFRIWDSYTKNLSLSQNMFLSTYSNLPSNIVGGYGYWCGYGSVTNHFILKDVIRSENSIEI